MKYSSRPLPIRIFNALSFGGKISFEKVIAKACNKAGLSDFGSPEIEVPLKRLIDSINNDAKLHSFGKFITKERLHNVLLNRLRITSLLKKHPEIKDIRIEKPIIICGLQRTGTTRLHRLLSGHNEVRSLKSWEALNPAPIPGDDDNKKRKSFAKIAERALKYMSPDFFAIHPVEHEAPEEDILLNDMSFMSTVPEATMNVPSYSDWLDKRGHKDAYSFLKLALQILSWQNPKGRWVLKTPQFMEFLEETIQVFPDAMILHPFRDPKKIVASFSSMLFQSYRVFSDKVNAEEVARHWMLKDAYMAKKAMKFWIQYPDVPVKHVSYYDMLSDFKSCMLEIYEFLDLSVSEENLQTLDVIAAKNKQHKYGVHKYKLEDFKIEGTEVNAFFSEYRSTFNIPDESE